MSFTVASRIKINALQIYRAAILVAITVLVREHQIRVRIEGDVPVSIDEVRAFLPKAESLRGDDSPKMGLRVFDDSDREIGYAVRTAPFTDRIIGYQGPSDTLLVFDADFKVVGARLRGSQDTREHAGKVRDDPYFLKTWDGMAGDKVAGMVDLEKAGIEGVSGATLTRENPRCDLFRNRKIRVGLPRRFGGDAVQPLARDGLGSGFKTDRAHRGRGVACGGMERWRV